MMNRGLDAMPDLLCSSFLPVHLSRSSPRFYLRPKRPPVDNQLIRPFTYIAFTSFHASAAAKFASADSMVPENQPADDG
jgi:hypothetical protein